MQYSQKVQPKDQLTDKRDEKYVTIVDSVLIRVRTSRP